MAFTVDYQSAYGDSEEWRKAKVVCLPKRFHVRPDGTAFTTVVYVTFDRSYDKHQALRAARSMFNTYCTHSYDCCGHWYYSVGWRVVKVKGRTWKIELRSILNV